MKTKRFMFQTVFLASFLTIIFPCFSADHFAHLYDEFGGKPGYYLKQELEQWLDKDVYLKTQRIDALELIQYLEKDTKTFAIDAQLVLHPPVKEPPTPYFPAHSIPGVSDSARVVDIFIREGTHSRRYWLALICDRIDCNIVLTKKGRLVLTKNVSALTLALIEP